MDGISGLLLSCLGARLYFFFCVSRGLLFLLLCCLILVGSRLFAYLYGQNEPVTNRGFKDLLFTAYQVKVMMDGWSWCKYLKSSKRTSPGLTPTPTRNVTSLVRTSQPQLPPFNDNVELQPRQCGDTANATAKIRKP